MEQKPVFCSECGAKLTGSGSFCSACGMKQAAVPAPEAVVIPVAEPAPAPEVVVAPVVAPAPDNSIAAPKAKISIFGLILAIAAVLMTFAVESIQMYTVASQAQYGVFSFEALWAYLRNPAFFLGLLTAWFVPLVAVVMVLIRKKPAALVGLILAGLSLLAQIIMAAAYSRLMRGHVPALFRVLPVPINTILNMVNGEGLFDTLRRMVATKALWSAYGLRSLFTVLGYYLKNILAVVACLMAVTKKQK